MLYKYSAQQVEANLSHAQITKNYTRQDIKTEGSLICIKAREAKKMGSCLASKGLNGQKPTLVYDKKHKGVGFKYKY